MPDPIDHQNRFAHQWEWGDDSWPPIYRNDSQGIAYIRISECPVEQQQALWDWIELHWVTRPVIEGIDPKDHAEQDALYVWDYAAFLNPDPESEFL